MTKEKGVTLISLAIYIATILIVIGILATITNTFKNNIKEINSEGSNNYEIDRFNLYFLGEVKIQGNEIETETGNEILFTSGNKYTYNASDKSIYLNDSIRIAENINSCVFASNIDEKEEDEKTIITVTIQAINGEEKTLEYVLNDEVLVAVQENEEDYVYIPQLYQQVAYIESNGTQYIDTGYIPVYGDNFEIKNITTNLNTINPIFSAGTGTYQLILLEYNNGRTYFKNYSTGAASEYYRSKLTNSNIKIEDGKVYIDDGIKCTSAYGRRS